VQRIEDRTSGKHLRPNHRRRYDKDTLANATNREANQLGRHDKQPLVCVGKEPMNKWKWKRHLKMKRTYKVGSLTVEDPLGLNGQSLDVA
jgi:hypothetical protein